MIIMITILDNKYAQTEHKHSKITGQTQNRSTLQQQLNTN